jgi:hypothetical protein
MDQYSSLQKSCAEYNLLNFSLYNFLHSTGASCLFQVFSEPILTHRAIIFPLCHVKLQVKIFLCTVLHEHCTGSVYPSVSSVGALLSRSSGRCVKLINQAYLVSRLCVFGVEEVQEQTRNKPRTAINSDQNYRGYLVTRFFKSSCI